MRKPIAVAFGVAALACVAYGAFAQRMDPRRPMTVVVGPPKGASPSVRVDARRSGLSRTALPRGPLRVEWRKSLGSSLDLAPLAIDGGDILVVSARGELAWLDASGTEKTRISVGSGATGAPCVLSDGTAVVVSAGGEAVGVVRDTVRFRTHLGGDRALTGRIAPLALDDGGVVVATSTELSVLDADGGVRAQATAPEPLASPLLATSQKIIAIGATGIVYSWTPGREIVRAGSFGAPIDGSAALIDENTLVAIVEETRIVALDLAHGVAAPRATAPTGYYLGPPAVRGQTIYAFGYAQTQLKNATFVVAVDGSGAEVMRSPVAASPQPTMLDGGVTPFTAPPHTGVLVDATGTVAFGAPDGTVGIVDPSGVASLLPTGESVCTKIGSFRPANIVALTPLGPGAFLVACDNGTLARIGSGSSPAP